MQKVQRLSQESASTNENRFVRFAKRPIFAMRPNVVLFGEVPYGMDWIPSYLKKACVFISVGTSGTVYPATNFVRETKASIRINLDLDPLIHPYSKFNHRIYGKCTETLPPLLERIKERINVATERKGHRITNSEHEFSYISPNSLSKSFGGRFLFCSSCYLLE